MAYRYGSDRLRRIVQRLYGLTDGDRNQIYRALDDVDAGREGKSVVKAIVAAVRRILKR